MALISFCEIGHIGTLALVRPFSGSGACVPYCTGSVFVSSELIFRRKDTYA